MNETFKDFLQEYNKEEVDPTLECIEKVVDFHHNKTSDVLCGGLQMFVSQVKYFKVSCLDRERQGVIGKSM